MRVIICVFFLIILNACAVVKSPTGGPQDLIPPKIISEKPFNKTLNFAAKEIEITFDDYIILKNINKELVISPTLKLKPIVEAKKKTLYVKNLDSLEENTTYKFNFGKSIADITEGNFLSNYDYVFSTGGFIDSCEISGNLSDAFSQAPEKDQKILLYEDVCDTCILYKQPKYYCSTDQLGQFKLRNIKNGKYLIYGLEDKNNNNVFDIGERISFDTIIDLMRSVSATSYLRLFMESQIKLEIRSSKCVSRNEHLFVFNKAAEFRKIELFDVSKNEIKNKILINEASDTVRIWIKECLKDSILVVFITEPNGNKIEKIIANPKVCKNSNFSKISVINDLYGLNRSILIIVNDPIDKIEEGKLIILDEGINISENYMLKKLNEVVYKLDGNLPPGKNYTFIFDDSLFTFYGGTFSDSFKYSLSMRNESELGAIKVAIQNNTDCPIICELINSNGKIKRREVVKPLIKEEIGFANLTPGSYRIRYICDSNNNNKWDTGSLFTRLKPERVLYSKEINLKASWEVEEPIIEID